MPAIRLVLAYSTVTFFILYVLLSGVANQIATGWFLSKSKFPDFSFFKSLDTLSVQEFPIDDPSKRVILVGDIHGMYGELQALLRKVSYDPSSDTLISVGDIVAKGPHKGSMAVLDYMSSNNITAVRGNHDQKVIEWYSWLRWMQSLSGGSEFVKSTREKWIYAQEHGVDDPEVWIEMEMRRDKGNNKWWKRIPDGWTLFGDHFEIAYAMDDAAYDYMVSMPLKLHIPHAHAFVAHAGILASDPRYKPWHKNQPLSKIPVLPRKQPPTVLRQLQESAILTDVPQNTDPWVTLNMRGVEDKEVTRGKTGTPWSDLYKADMKRCKGFKLGLPGISHDKDELPCNPATVIYGHAASRGLDVKRWTIGLDSGCVYERRMTALVLGGKARVGEEEEEDEEEDDDDDDDEYDDDDFDFDRKRSKSTIKFGDKGSGKLVSVSCS